eukprot:2662564-Rhodomonas_salina.2
MLTVQTVTLGTGVSSLTVPALLAGEVDPKIAQNVAKFAHLRTHKNATVRRVRNPAISSYVPFTPHWCGRSMRICMIRRSSTTRGSWSFW